MEKVHLGDGAYAICDGYGITLTAENGLFVSDTIYLEPVVLERLIAYATVAGLVKKGV